MILLRAKSRSDDLVMASWLRPRLLVVILAFKYGYLGSVSALMRNKKKLLRIDLDSAHHESPSQLLLWAQDKVSFRTTCRHMISTLNFKFIEKLRARVSRSFYQFCFFFAITAFIVKPSTMACTYP